MLSYIILINTTFLIFDNFTFQYFFQIVKMANGLDLSFTTVDYAVFGIMLVISFGIGVYHAFMSSTTKEGLLKDTINSSIFQKKKLKYIIFYDFLNQILSWGPDLLAYFLWPSVYALVSIRPI